MEKAKFVIKDVFSIIGIGTVVTGIIEKGMITVGMKGKLDNDKEIEVIKINRDNFEIENALEGEEVGLLLKGVDKNDLKGCQCIYF